MAIAFYLAIFICFCFFFAGSLLQTQTCFIAVIFILGLSSRLLYGFDCVFFFCVPTQMKYWRLDVSNP